MNASLFDTGHIAADSAGTFINILLWIDEIKNPRTSQADNKKITRPQPPQPVHQVVSKTPSTALALDNTFYKQRLYLHNSELFDASAVIVEIRAIAEENPDRAKGTHVLILNRTIFHPQGGGQPADSGTVVTESGKVFTVTFVQNSKDGTNIEHVGTVDNMDGFDAGVNAQLHVNRELRLENIRLHSAGHVIDAAVTRLGLADKLRAGKGFHFRTGPYVEYIGALDANVIDSLPARLNEAVAEIIAEDMPTSVRIVSRAEAGEICGCDTSTYPDVVRVVTVADQSCPCGGTHVISTKQLGKVIITRVKKKKNNVKVSYELGSGGKKQYTTAKVTKEKSSQSEALEAGGATDSLDVIVCRLEID